MVKIHLFGRFRSKAGGIECVECTGGNVPTVKSVLDELVEKFPGLKSELFDGEDLQHGVQVSLDKRNIRLMLDGIDSHIEGKGEVIEIHPSILDESDKDEKE